VAERRKHGAPAHGLRRALSRESLRFALGLILVALSAAAFAIAFRASLAFVLRAFADSPDVVTAMKQLPFWPRFLLPAVGGLLAGVLGLFVARAPAGHGVGDVMEAVVLGRVQLSLPVTLLKSLASWFAIAFGGSLGREGPLIQFGGAAGNAVSGRLKLAAERTRVLIAAGTAAGFAAAYNTPFAAVLFVLEVVTGVVVLDAIVPALVATVIASAATRAVVGEGPIYGQRAFHLQSSTELLSFALLGVLIAFGAQGFMRFLWFGEKAFRGSPLRLPWRRRRSLWRASWRSFECERPRAERAPRRASQSASSPAHMGKCLATTASVSSGSPGGVFTPTLLVGGGLGFLYANAMGAALHIGPAGGYALVGMAAAIAATTRAPLMAAVMVFELSGDYAIVLPLMLATAVATLVSRWLGRESIYTAELRQRGIGWEMTMEGRRVLS
jgi:CIC family chloride channel protein